MSLKVVGSEPCPYHEDGQNSQVDCLCTVGDQISLYKHVEFKGSYKRAFYGLVGPQNQVCLVHEKMQCMEDPDGIYTLIVDCGNDASTIEQEIKLFQKIKQVDPTGDFTPLLVHCNRISKGSADYKALEKICANVRAYQDVKYKSVRCRADRHGEKEEGQELVEMIEGIGNLMYFMYVTDVGMLSYDYVSDDDNIRDSSDVIRATRKLAEDYQKLAKKGIGHYDLHGNNIMCKKRNGKLCLSIIDFGFGFAIEEGIARNVLHFLFSGVNFDNPEKTKVSIRHCDPVHYNMFVMCFGMLRRILNETEQATLSTVETIIEDMYDSAFAQEVPDCKSVHMKRFNVLEACIIESYKEFYSKTQLQGIWKRVCEKTYVVVSDFLKRDRGMQDLSARMRDTQNMYIADNFYEYATEETNAFTILFDAFSMAFYDRKGQHCDQIFLRKKFDEYSIANISVFILKKGMDATVVKVNKFPFRNECMNLQKLFSAPNFFLRNDQCGYQPHVVDSPIFPHRNESDTLIYREPRKRMHPCTPTPSTTFQTSTPAAKRREEAPTTLVYTPARSLGNFHNVPRLSPLAYQRVSGRQLGLEDIVPTRTTTSIERDLPGVETNFGEGTGFTLFSPTIVSRQNGHFYSAYAAVRPGNT